MSVFTAGSPTATPTSAPRWHASSGRGRAPEATAPVGRVYAERVKCAPAKNAQKVVCLSAKPIQSGQHGMRESFSGRLKNELFLLAVVCQDVAYTDDA